MSLRKLLRQHRKDIQEDRREDLVVQKVDMLDKTESLLKSLKDSEKKQGIYRKLFWALKIGLIIAFLSGSVKIDIEFLSILTQLFFL